MWGVIIVFVIIVIIINALNLGKKHNRYRGYKRRRVYDYPKSADEKGKEGERLVSKELGGTIEGIQYLFNDYKFRDGEKTVQIDHIFVNKNGVFVIETKNWSGTVYGNDNQEQWTQFWRNGHKETLYNPVRQNKAHCAKLNKLLPNYVHLSPLVVMAQNNSHKISSQYTIPLFELSYYVKQFYGCELTSEQITEIVEILNKNNDRTISNYEHVDNIQKMKNDVKMGICPRCGGKLVIRNGNGYTFWGCSNYPKCRFTKKLNKD